MWGAVHQSHARLLYTLQSHEPGRPGTQGFRRDPPARQHAGVAKGNEAETLSIQTAFAKANGISEADFKREYNGFAVSTRMKRAEEINLRYRIESVPVIFINGKYQTDVSMAGGEQQLLQLITDLAAVEKGR